MVEPYLKGDCHFVLTLKPKGGVENFQLLFFVVPTANEGGRFSADMDVERNKSRIDNGGDKFKVLCAVS